MMYNQPVELLSVPALSDGERRREDLEFGGKILLPPTLLEKLSRLNVSFPMLFKLTNPNNNITTHCGVLEFTADEGTVCLPGWVMETMSLIPDDTVLIECVKLPVATYGRFQPQSTIFLDISNPKAVLENTLRKFACLSVGDIFKIDYNNRTYGIKVEEVKPGDAVSIIECDMEVDFSPPVGYVEDQTPVKTSRVRGQSQQFKPFSGKGNRLDGKRPRSEEDDDVENEPSISGIPDYDYKPDRIEFMRNVPVLKRSPSIDYQTSRKKQFKW